MNRFGDYLYTLRREKRMTQAELADLLGITNKAVSKGKQGFHLVKDTTSKPTLTFAQPIQPEGWITRKGGMRPVEG